MEGASKQIKKFVQPYPRHNNNNNPMQRNSFMDITSCSLAMFCRCSPSVSVEHRLREKRHVVTGLLLGPRRVHGVVLPLLLLVLAHVRTHRVVEPGGGEREAAAALRRRAGAAAEAERALTAEPVLLLPRLVRHARLRREVVAGVVRGRRRRRRGPVECGAATRRGHVVVVLALVRGDHGAQVVRRALHMLAHRAPGRRALVVAPAVTRKTFTMSKKSSHLHLQ